MNKKIKILFVVVSVVALSAITIFSLVSLHIIKIEQKVQYSCLYESGSNDIRCVNGSGFGGCYGEYSLLGVRPEDGIQIHKEGLITTALCDNPHGKRLYYDDKGRFIK